MELNWFEWIENNSKKIGVVFIIITIGIVALVSFFSLKKDAANIVKEKELTIETTPTPSETTSTENIIRNEGWMVDVKGEVINPGTYAVEDNMRLSDVILLAGGLTEQADTSITNLSKKVTDEMVIVIYSKEEVEEIKKRTIQENPTLECGPDEIILNGQCSLQNTPSLEQNGQLVTSKVNINQAGKEELMQIPGIGDVKATSIIEYRTNNGPFQTIEDIKNVTGIGENTFESIKDYITV